MFDGDIVGDIDVAQMALYGFFLFFVALVFWLRREDRREGYPLEDEFTGAVQAPGGPLSTAKPKTWTLPFDRGTATAPPAGRDPVNIAARKTENFPGAPLVPTGNPLLDGIGPAGYAQRADWPDQFADGAARIVPLSSDDEISVESGSIDPHGLSVYGADHKKAGTVTDLWVDRAEHVIRYLEVDTGSGKVLAPMAMAIVKKHGVLIDAIYAEDFPDVPKLASPTQITRLEEEKVIAYFGGGYLYANRARQEPLI